MGVSATFPAQNPCPSVTGCRVVVFRPLDDCDVPPHWNPDIPEKDARGRRRESGFGTTSSAFLAAISERGWRIDDVAVAAAGPENGLFRFHFPRDVSWLSLPAVGRPDLRHGILSHPFTAEGRMTDDCAAPTWSALPDAAEAVIVDSPHLDDLVFWNAVGPHWSEIETRGIGVHWFDGSRMSEIGRGERDERAGRMRARNRLEWNFALNFTVFASRAVASIAIEEAWTRHAYRQRMPRLDGSSTRAFSPLAVQMLYALDRMYLVEDPVRNRNSHEHWSRLIRACPWVRLSAAGTPVFEWRGTGKFAPLVCTVREPRGRASDIEGIDVWNALVELDIEGLVAVDLEGRMGVSSRGRKLVEKVGRSAEDPDMPLRWRDGGGAVVPAIDRWLNKAFRPMKRRVASLPASPFIEVEGGVSERHVVSGRRLVYGGRVSLGPEAMRDPDIAEAVRRTFAEQAKLPPDRRRVGKVHSDRMVAPEHPDCLWFGVPIGVAHEICVQNETVGWYCNLERFSAEVAASAAALPPALRPLVEDGFDRVLSVEEVSETQHGDLLVPTVPATVRRAAPRVIVGWIREASDLSELDPERLWLFDVSNMRVEPLGGGVSLSVQGAARFGIGGARWSGREVGHLDGAGNLVPVTTDEGRLARYVARHVREDRDDLFLQSTHVPLDGLHRFGAWVVEVGKAPLPYRGGCRRVASALAAARAQVERHGEP